MKEIITGERIARHLTQLLQVSKEDKKREHNWKARQKDGKLNN